MLLHAALVLVLAPTSSVLSAEAAEFNTRAMVHYDAGRLAQAVDEFQAGYRAMPDARRDRAGRESLLGSMRMTLLALHRETGETAPLCRLQGILNEHLDALTAAHPDDPDRIEIRSARARHEEVTAQLAALGPDACAPPREDPPVAVPTLLPVAERPTPPAATTPTVVAPTPVEDRSPRRQLIAGGVMLPLGLVALGTIGMVAPRHRRNLADFDTLTAEHATRPCTEEDCTRMRELLTATRRQEGLMIALGISGGALVSAGAALLIRGAMKRRRARLGLDLRSHHVGLMVAGEF